MSEPGITPEVLLQQFRFLFDAQTKSLRGLATASDVGVETIRGWKDEGRFPRNGDDFVRVVRTCLKSLRSDSRVPAWTPEQWEIRYQEARRVWENQTGDRHAPKVIPSASPSQSPSSSVQVFGGDYVAGSKNTAHFGNVNHYTDPRPQG